MSPKQWLVVCNGTLDERIIQRDLPKAFDDAGLGFRLISTSHAGQAGELLAQGCRDGFRNIAIAGGDGTLHEAVNGLAVWGGDPMDVLVGLIPMGTGNDIARGLGIPSEPSQAATILAEGQSRLLDVGIVQWEGGTRRFINTLGMGLDVAVLEGMDRSWGRWAYLKGVLKAIPESRAFEACIKADGKNLTGNFMSTVVMLGRYTGGGMRPSRDASFGTGYLHGVSIKPLGWWGTLKRLPRLMTCGLGEDDNVLQWRATTINISTADSVRFHVDGELTGHTPCSVTLQRAGIKFAVSRE